MSTAEAARPPLTTPVTPPPVGKQGELDGKSVVKWQKPLCIALAIIGIIGLAVAGTGLASFGTHQNYWAAGALSNLSQLNAIIMMGVGGGCAVLALAVGIMSLVKAPLKEQRSINDTIDIMQLHEELKEGEWTYARQLNGNYSVVERLLNEQGSDVIKVRKKNIPWQQLHENPPGRYKQTSPTRAGDLLIHMDVIKELLGPGHFTIVRRVDGDYQLVTLAPPKSGREEKKLKIDEEVVPVSGLSALNKKGVDLGLIFQKSSPVYQSEPLIDIKRLEALLEPGTFTAVLCLNGKYRCFVKEKGTSKVVDKRMEYDPARIHEAIKSNKKLFGCSFEETSPLPESSKK